MAQMVKNLPEMQETWAQSLGREDPLEEEMATNTSILAWTVPWTEKPGGLQSMGLQRAGHNWAINNILIEKLHWRYSKNALKIRQKVYIAIKEKAHQFNRW